MSDQVTSGEPNAVPATAPEAAPAAAPVGDSKPIGSFGNARGSGLSRGKRATPPAASPAASSVSASSYTPTSVEVITPQREYTHPFAPAAAAPAPAPAPVAAPEAVPAPTPVGDAPATPAAPVEGPRAATPVAARGSEMFPYMPTAGNEPKPGSPQPRPATGEKAEIKILPPAEVKRPSVSWGDGTNDEDTRPQPDQRATFRPERREAKPFEQRENKPYEPREPKPFQPREPKPYQAREPRRDGSFQQRNNNPQRDTAVSRVEEPAKSSGGFIGWLKSLFGGKPAEPQKVEAEARDNQYREGDQRRRNRGGRGRGGYQGDNRNNRDYQPRDPRDEPQGESSSYQGGGDQQGGQGQGERRYEGGGGRRRRRGGRGRNRDDRGGPQSEGQQGGGAI